MVHRRGLIQGGGAALGLLGMAGRPHAAVAPSVTGPLPDTATRGLLVWDLTPGGYVAEEYLVSGAADVYDAVSAVDARDANTRDYGRDQSNRNYHRPVVRAGQPYRTRVIVYRPADPRRFSGNVIVEPLHPNGGGSPNVLGRISKYWMDHGDAIITVHMPAQLDALKAADPARYGEVLWSDPTQLWGMLADAARLVRSASSPLGLRGRRLYMTGYSHTGVITAVFLNYHHDKARRTDGGPLFDGYVSMAGAVYTKPLDVPVIRLNTQGDFDSFGALARRSPDSDARGSRHRHYELTGCAHSTAPVPEPGEARRPARTLPVMAGAPNIDAASCRAQFPAGSVNNDYPIRIPMAAIFENLYAWVEKGVAPLRAERIDTDSDGAIRLDAFGNGVGGVRLPQVSVPIARYGVGQGATCRLFGFTEPFAPGRKRQLYGSHANYVAMVRAEADRLRDRRIILAGGADDLVRIAEASPRF